MEYVLQNFDDNLKDIIETGHFQKERTGKGCYTKFGVLTTVDCSERFPISTRRKTSWKSMLNEYLWFLTGSDKISDLQKMGSKVWNPWIDDVFTSTNGYEPTSIGYGYGPNLINYGGELNDGKGFNQIDYVLNELKTNKNSRRILFNFWRPDKIGIGDVKLPPCHVIYQFLPSPDENGEMTRLSVSVYQRSNDYFVGGLSTNIQGAGFFLYMFAQQSGMTPDKIYHFSGHAHVYSDHVELVKEYLNRSIIKSPKLILNKKNSIYEYTSSDFVLEDYDPLEKMEIPIAV